MPKQTESQTLAISLAHAALQVHIFITHQHRTCLQCSAHSKGSAAAQVRVWSKDHGCGAEKGLHKSLQHLTGRVAVNLSSAASICWSVPEDTKMAIPL